MKLEFFQNLSVSPLDGSRILVTWSAPLYPAGELVSYTIYLKDLNTGFQLRKDIPASHDRRYHTGSCTKEKLFCNRNNKSVK